MAHPEVGRHESADDGALERRTLLARLPQANIVETEQAVALEPNPLLEPQPVVALLGPGCRKRLIEQAPAGGLTVGIELIVLHNAARGVGDVLQTCLAVDDPDLLACCGDLDADVAGWLANHQTKGAPVPIDARLEALIRCNAHRSGHRRDAWQQLVARRVGDVRWNIVGGGAWCEQRGSGKGANGREDGALAWERTSNHGGP